ncbi:hypothetical protein JCM11251_002899 [Rhodosporidiobolus azoricus]
MDNVTPPVLAALPQPSPNYLPTSSTLPPRPAPRHAQPGQAATVYSTRPRPPPARQGAPASQRNFAQSSAGGATSHLGVGASLNGGPPPALGPSVGSGGSQSASRGPSPRGLGRGASRGGVDGRVEEGGGAGTGRNAKKEVGVLSEAQKNKRAHWGDSYVPAEETIRNDYSSEYVQTGARPQNHLRNTAVETRFAEYPKLALLLTHKHSLTSSPQFSIPPTYFNLSSLPPIPSRSPLPSPPPSEMQRALSHLAPSRFDSILLTPPPHISFEELAALDLGRAAATPGFVWLWVGSGQTGAGAGRKGVEGEQSLNVGGGVGLEKGRELLSLWGYRRGEDIVWLKTNKRDPEGDLTNDPSPLFTSTIEHCLMGIRGTVRRSTDSNIVHCNVDTDVLVWEGDEADPSLKPPELQSLIENFCMGTRRLHLYGSPHALRRGWLTVSSPAALPSPSSPSKPSVALDYNTLSPVFPVEKEGSEEEQRQRWGPAREWDRKEWEGRWRRPGVGVGGGMAKSLSIASAGENGAKGSRTGSGAEVQQEVVRVESLLPFVEELDALRPKSPPQRNGVPSSGGLGRGRGAGLGVTRSGLVAQQGSQSSSGTSTPQVQMSGVGRGRGRGNGLIPPPSPGQAMVAPPPPPPMGMPYPTPAPLPPPHPTGSAPPFPGYPYQQHHFPPPQMPASQQQGTPLHPHPMRPYQSQLKSFNPTPPPSFPPSLLQHAGSSSYNQSLHFQPQQLHPHYQHMPQSGSPFSSPAPPPPPSAPPSFQGYSPSPNPGSPYTYHPPPPSNPYQSYQPHSLSPSPALSAAQLPPGVNVHPGFFSPSPLNGLQADNLSTLLANQHLSQSYSPLPFPSSASSVASGFSPSPGLSPITAPHYLPRMPSNASLALSAGGGGGGGDVGPDGELIYPISSRRASITSAASASGLAGGGGGGFTPR